MASDLGFDDDFMATMLGDFLDESAGYLTRLNENLLAMEEAARSLADKDEVSVDREVLNGMFRDAHSLKGLSAMLQLGDINRLTHKVENVLDGARQGTLRITHNVIDLVFQAVDRLTAMVDRLKDSTLADVEYESIIEEIGKVLDRSGNPCEPACEPEVALTDNPRCSAIKDQLTASIAENQEARLPLDISDEMDIPETHLSIGNAREAPQNGKGTSTVGDKEKPAETLRVDIERLDQLMNLAGQLVINKARFRQLGDQLKSFCVRNQSTHALANVAVTLDKMMGVPVESARPDYFVEAVREHVAQIRKDLVVVQSDIARLCEARMLANGFSEAVHQLDRVSRGIQKSVMDTRMVPIGPLFGRFRRVIRDITRDNGKDVDLVIHGEKTELDKRMIDELGDPLIHMVRNAADHGIELPVDREASGKPRRGTITLDAFHRGNRIFVRVRDDGRGLDPGKIRDKAISKGIINQQDAERLSTQQLFQLIWEPGFSTADKVTEVSGRGMGMDIVRSKIEQLNGLIELESNPGMGTTITIKLPLTMAILPSLLAVNSEDVFAIPVESVVEIVSISRADLTTVQGVPTARVRGRFVSVVNLAECFQGEEPRSVRNTAVNQTLVIVGSDGQELGLVVERLLGQQDVVIKSLSENYRSVEGLAGASILGDGRVALILDVAALIDILARDPYGRDRTHG